MFSANILTVYDSKFIKRIFGPEKEEKRGGWKELGTKELLNL